MTWAKKVDIDERISQALNIFHHVVVSNHGVKEANVLSLLLPLGFPLAKIDPSWLADMDSFGSKRGQVAHSSMVRTAIDPGDELASVRRLLIPMAALDFDLGALL